MIWIIVGRMLPSELRSTAFNLDKGAANSQTPPGDAAQDRASRSQPLGHANTSIGLQPVNIKSLISVTR